VALSENHVKKAGIGGGNLGRIHRRKERCPLKKSCFETVGWWGKKISQKGGLRKRITNVEPPEATICSKKRGILLYRREDLR